MKIITIRATPEQKAALLALKGPVGSMSNFCLEAALNYRGTQSNLLLGAEEKGRLLQKIELTEKAAREAKEALAQQEKLNRALLRFIDRGLLFEDASSTLSVLGPEVIEHLQNRGYDPGNLPPISEHALFGKLRIIGDLEAAERMRSALDALARRGLVTIEEGTGERHYSRGPRWPNE